MKNKRFNIADALIIVVAVACVIGIVIRANHKKNGKYLEDETYNITFSASALTAEDVKDLTVGAKVVTDGKKTVGTLHEGYWTELDEDGTYTLKASVTCRGIVTEKGFLSDGKLYCKGDVIGVTVGKLKLTVTVTDFVKSE